MHVFGEKFELERSTGWVGNETFEMGVAKTDGFFFSG